MLGFKTDSAVFWKWIPVETIGREQLNTWFRRQALHDPS